MTLLFLNGENDGLEILISRMSISQHHLFSSFSSQIYISIFCIQLQAKHIIEIGMDYWNIESRTKLIKCVYFVYIYYKAHYVNEYFIGHKIRLKVILFVVMFTKSFFSLTMNRRMTFIEKKYLINMPRTFWRVIMLCTMLCFEEYRITKY